MKKSAIFLSTVLIMITLAGLYSCTSSKSSTGKLFKFNLEKGKGYDYEMIWDMQTKVMEQQTKVSISGHYSMNVTDDDGKIKSISTEYKSLRMNINTGEIEINMDSNKPPGNGSENPLENMMGKVFSSMVGKPFIIKVDEDGKVVEVTGFEAIINNMVDSLGVDADTKAIVMASMKDQFNDNTIKDQFAQVFTIFPNKEIKAGDSWEKSYNTTGKMAANFSTTYTVKEIEGDHVTLTANTIIDSNTEGDGKITGKQTGNLVVDSKTGLVINAEFSQDMEVTTSGVKVAITGKGKIKGTAKER